MPRGTSEKEAWLQLRVNSLYHSSWGARPDRMDAAVARYIQINETFWPFPTRLLGQDDSLNAFLNTADTVCP